MSYVISWAGQHSDRLRGKYPSIASAMQAIRLVFAVSDQARESICRSNEAGGSWSVYSCRKDRDYDRHGDAPHLAIASIERAPVRKRAHKELSW